MNMDFAVQQHLTILFLGFILVSCIILFTFIVSNKGPNPLTCQNKNNSKIKLKSTVRNNF